ncbi:MAG: polysaccharide biosynthesis tyrosine autokinase [Ruminococcus sp.]
MNTSNSKPADNTINLLDLLQLFISKLWLIILVSVAGGAAAFSWAKFMMPLEYSSHISMYVQSYTDIQDNGMDNYNYNDISKSKQLINTYIEVLKDDAVMDSVGAELMTKFDADVIADSFAVVDNKIKPASLRSAISITTVTDTSALTVSATTHNAELSAAVVNEIAKQGDSFVAEAIGIGSIKTIDTARVYETPVAPNVKKITAMGAMAGFVLTLMIIFLIDFFDKTIRSGEELSRCFEKPILGEIQYFDTSDAEEKKKRRNKKVHSTDIKRSTLLDENIPFYVTESYKAMRTNIVFALSPCESKIIAVSSPTPGEGKSTTASNIAIALAQGGHSTLLVEADLRKPVIYKQFNLKNKKGLSTVISKQGKFDDCAHKKVIDNLDVLTSGPIPPNPSELLASGTAKRLLEELSEKYDYVVIDTPPINVVSDAAGLSESVAGLLLVTRFGLTTYDEVETAAKNIELANMNLLGFVINGIKTQGGSYYNSKYSKYGYKKYGRYGYKKYGYGYGYGEYTEDKDDDSTKKGGEKI